MPQPPMPIDRPIAVTYLGTLPARPGATVLELRPPRTAGPGRPVA